MSNSESFESFHYQHDNPDKEPEASLTPDLLPSYIGPIIPLHHMGEAALNLTYENTDLFEFRPQYGQDHIYITAGAIPRIIFRNHDAHTEDLYERLDDLWFPKHRAYQPTLRDADVYVRYQANQIDSDMHVLFGEDH